MAEPSTGPRILCLDGGGIRGLSEILILKELMLQVRINNNLDYTPEPRQCFDLICGTSTGGLLAVLLGRLGKSLAECESLFRSFGSEIFAGGFLRRASRMVFTGSRHGSEGLVRVIQAEAGANQDDMFEPDEDSSARGHVPVAVVSVSKTGRCEHLFRTYGVRASATSCSIVDACLATSAATTFFPSITINGVEYVDGAVKWNNPSSIALSELESTEWLAPLHDAVTGVGCFVSVGTGRPTFNRGNSTLSRLLPNGPLSLKDAATLCKDIALDCHRMHLEVESRFKKAGAVDAYHRFDVDVGLESVRLNESDEDALQHISAVTLAYMKGRGDDMGRCARMIVPKNKIDPESPIGQPLQTDRNRFPGLVCSRLPERTDHFYGRVEELLQIRHALDPSRPGQKTVLLYGIGGSGKTELALRHIYQARSCYSAIVWIDASTRDHATSSLDEAAVAMSSNWPPELPSLHRGRDIKSLLLVTSRLRSTRYTNWLLIVDSGDSLEEGELAEYIPACGHGSILVTSTRNMAGRAFNEDHRISVGGLDHESSSALLTGISERAGMTDEESAAAKIIIKELSGTPLALKQAGALIRDGEFTFSAFLKTYRKEYRRLMSDHPSQEGLWSSGKKSRAIVTILDMAYRSLKSPGHAELLIFIGVLGSWPIPMSFMEGFHFFAPNADEPSSTSDNLKILQIVHEPSFLRLALRQLARSCLIHLKEESNRIVSFTIHRVLFQWALEKAIAHNHQEYIMQAAYGLARAIDKGRPESVMLEEQSSLNAVDPVIERMYLAPFIHCLSIIPGHISQSDLDPDAGRFRVPYAAILHQAGWAHLAQGCAENAKACFCSSIRFEALRLRQAGVKWPEGATALGLLCGLSRACQKLGDLGLAVEALKSALPLSKRVHGHESDITITLVSRLKSTSERQETLQQHHKSAVIASTTTSQDPKVRKRVQEASHMDSPHGSAEPEGQPDLDQEWMTEAVGLPRAAHHVRAAAHLSYAQRSNHQGTTEAEAALLGASYQGDQDKVKLLLGLPNIKIDPKDDRGRTPLSLASKRGYEKVVQLLLDKGADIDSKDFGDQTPLTWAAQHGNIKITQMLLEKGVNIESKDCLGQTPLSWAALGGHEIVIRLLLEKGANIESKDFLGMTPLSGAVQEGYGGVIRMLLKKGADIESKEAGGQTPLAWAAQHGNERAIELLRGNGAG